MAIEGKTEKENEERRQTDFELAVAMVAKASSGSGLVNGELSVHPSSFAAVRVAPDRPWGWAPSSKGSMRGP